MDCLCCFLMGAALSIVCLTFTDSRADNLYENLKYGEELCAKNGGLKSFDYADNFECNDGASFNVEKRS